jgi:EmrB/QacA subfamily drug resistance transporter
MSEKQQVTLDDRPAAGWTPMIFIGLGVALIIMDASIVNVILPSIIRGLKINSIDAEWINATYSLTFAAFLIVMGRLGDRFGRRKIFMLGAGVFAVSSIAAASAPSGGLLIAARAAQGVGAAMMSPTSLSIVTGLYRGKARAIAFALYGSIIGGMAAIGPLMGAWLTEHFSWNWSFWINVPISLIIIVGSLKYVDEVKADDDSESPDLLGAFLSSLGIAALLFALIEGRSYGWWLSTSDKTFIGRVWQQGGLSPVAISLIISAVALVMLYVVETRRTAAGKSALIDFHLFRIRSFGLGSFAGLIVSLGEFGILFSLPLFLQSVLGWSALGSGGLLAMLAVGAFVAAPTAAMLANKRNPRFVARLGMGLEIIGILGLAAVLSPDASGWSMVLWLFIYGMGVGYATAQLTGLILSEIPPNKTGQASGTQSTARQIGASMGTAILGTVLFVTLHKYTEWRLTNEVPYLTAEKAREVADLVERSAGTAIPSLASMPNGLEIQAVAQQAFSAAISLSALVAAGFVFLGFLATFALPPGTAPGSAPAVSPSDDSDDVDQTTLIHDFE